jgi:hypothetical protein
MREGKKEQEEGGNNTGRRGFGGRGGRERHINTEREREE